MNPTDEFTKAVELSLKNYASINPAELGEDKFEGHHNLAQALASIQASTAELFTALIGDDQDHSNICLATSMSREAGDDPPEAFESHCDCDARGKNDLRRQQRTKIDQLIKDLTMSKRVTDQDEIYQLLLDDPAFTEAVHRDEKGVYLTGGEDASERRYITQLEMADGPLPDKDLTDGDKA